MILLSMRFELGYFYLFIAVIGEVIGTTYLKSTNNFSELMPFILLTLLSYFISGTGLLVNLLAIKIDSKLFAISDNSTSLPAGAINWIPKGISL